jgi:hypothetical protein
MKTAKSRAASPPNDKRRRTRARGIPKWISQQKDLNEMAQRRTLLVLSVLSGKVAVSDAISEAGISRGLYYQLETKAVNAMLRALEPGSEASGAPGAEGMPQRIRQLEKKVEQLTQEKRRTDRLLFLTRMVVKKGPVALEKRGRPRGRRSSTTNGQKSLPGSSSPATQKAPAVNSPSMPDGATMP